MTWLLVAGWALAALAVVALAVTWVGPALLLRRHGAIEAVADQAPLAQALLAELAPAARIICPRLFVIAARQPNGFALAGREASMVAVTEGVFETLETPQLRGLLALLIARLAHPRARIETTVAALAMLLAPFVLPSMALVRIGLRGDRWYEVDDSAAGLVGVEAVASTLERLEADRAGGGLEANSTASLFCVNPDLEVRLAARVFATQPTTDARIARLRQTCNSVARTFAIDRGYRIEAVTRARSGKPISSTLRTARLLIAKRGWTPRTASQRATSVRGPVDLITAVRVAFGGHPNALLEVTDFYALLAPIASVLGSSFAAWERRPDVDSSKVLAMLDDAIAFAVAAEDASPEILAVVNAAFARFN